MDTGATPESTINNRNSSQSAIDSPLAIDFQSAIDWELRGLVFDIRRFSTHDGPGIRTTVFTKGCPLRCLWCQNPEGIPLKQQLFYFRDKCIGCGTCIRTCPEQAISKSGDKITIDRQKCNLCGKCVEVCPPMALSFDSKEMTVRQVVDEILLDRDFFNESGGMTLSGGDPVFQYAFNINVLKACQENGIHTAIETSLYTDPKIIEAFIPHLNLLIADFKVFDAGNHLAWTGVSNDLIKQNFKRVIHQISVQKDNQLKPAEHEELQSKSKLPCELLVRIPLIPEHTATTENLRQTGEFFQALDPDIQIELLNYNPLAKNKYVLLEQDFLFSKNPKMFSNAEMDAFTKILTDFGIKAFHE